MKPVKILGLKKRDRVKEAVARFRSGKSCHPTAPSDVLELLILVGRMENAVLRNRVRRRVKEAVRKVLNEDPSRGGRVLVIRATSRDLTRDFEQLCKLIRDKLNMTQEPA